MFVISRSINKCIGIDIYFGIILSCVKMYTNEKNVSSIALISPVKKLYEIQATVTFGASKYTTYTPIPRIAMALQALVHFAIRDFRGNVLKITKKLIQFQKLKENNARKNRFNR